MPQFSLNPTTLGPPLNRCFLCENFQGPFVNTRAEWPGYGYIALCAPRYDEQGVLDRVGCVGYMAALSGMKYPHEQTAQAVRIAELEQQVAELKATQRIEMTQEHLDALLENVRPKEENNDYEVVEGTK